MIICLLMFQKNVGDQLSVWSNFSKLNITKQTMLWIRGRLLYTYIWFPAYFCHIDILIQKNQIWDTSTRKSSWFSQLYTHTVSVVNMLARTISMEGAFAKHYGWHNTTQHKTNRPCTRSKSTYSIKVPSVHLYYVCPTLTKSKPTNMLSPCMHHAQRLKNLS